MPKPVILAAFTAEEYEAIRRASVDAMPETFEAWLAGAHASAAAYREAGVDFAFVAVTAEQVADHARRECLGVVDARARDGTAREAWKRG